MDPATCPRRLVAGRTDAAIGRGSAYDHGRGWTQAELAGPLG